MTAERATFICSFALLLSGITDRAKADTRAGTLSNHVGSSSENSGNGDEKPATLLTMPGVASYQPLTGKERWSLYLREAFWSPAVFMRAAGPALGAQRNNEPPAWGQGAEGYSKRLANRFGRFALQETYEAAGAAALGHEVRYIRSKRSGFLPRAAQALTSNFVTYDRNGERHTCRE